MILEALIAAQLVGANSELKKQSRLQNKWANNALEWMLFMGAVYTFVLPFRYTREAWRWSKAAGVFFGFMMMTALLALPLLFFIGWFITGMIVFAYEQDREYKGLPPRRVKNLPPPDPETRAKTRTVLEVDAETGEVLRTYEEPLPRSS